MSLKEFTIGTVKLASLVVVKFVWTHAPEIIQFCMLIYAIGLALQTIHRGYVWAQAKIAAWRAPA